MELESIIWTIAFIHNGYTHRQDIDSAAEDSTATVVGAVLTNRTWQITLEDNVDVRNIVENGLPVNSEDIEAQLTNNNVLPVSFLA